MIKYSTLFFLRKEKTVEATGLSPLYLRISCGKKTELSLNKHVRLEKWNAQKQRLNGNSPEAKSINEFITGIEVKLHNIQTALLNKGEIIDATILKAHLLGRTEKQKTILYAFDSHLKFKQKDYNPSTYKKYGYCKDHLENFIWKYFNVSDILLHKVDLHFIREFQCYLREPAQFVNEQGLTVYKAANGHNSTLKYIKMLKTVINGAIAFKWIDNDPFVGFKDGFQTKEQVYLTDRELRQIMALKIAIQRLDVVKDLFVFCCFTGLAYSDLNKLSSSHIVLDIEGKKWIHITRTKSKTKCTIPILPKAANILEKYKKHPVAAEKGTLLPVLSNQNYNGYLKEISDLASLSKNLTTHVARRTFGSVALNAGVPPATIIKIIGHTTFKNLHLYAILDENTLSNDMKILSDKFEKPSPGGNQFSQLKQAL